MTPFDVQYIKTKHEKTLRKLPNVLGVAYGHGTTAGIRRKDVSVLVLVRKKKDKKLLSKKELVPKTIEGIPTDVIEVGNICIQNKRVTENCPAFPGMSIGHYEVTAGTFGAMVTDSFTGDRVILSNNHVLANSNFASIGDKILQPGLYDGGKKAIATLLRFVPIKMANETCVILSFIEKIINMFAKLIGKSFKKSQPVNRVDAAVALPFAGTVGERVYGLGDIMGWTYPHLGDIVIKSGRTTGITEGEVIGLGATVTVSYGNNREAVFENQIITTNMSQGGDSGSILLSANSHCAVGLLFAGSDTVTIFNSIDDVMSELKIKI